MSTMYQGRYIGADPLLREQKALFREENGKWFAQFNGTLGLDNVPGGLERHGVNYTAGWHEVARRDIKLKERPRKDPFRKRRTSSRRKPLLAKYNYARPETHKERMTKRRIAYWRYCMRRWPKSFPARFQKEHIAQ